MHRLSTCAQERYPLHVLVCGLDGNTSRGGALEPEAFSKFLATQVGFDLSSNRLWMYLELCWSRWSRLAPWADSIILLYFRNRCFSLTEPRDIIRPYPQGMSHCWQGEPTLDGLWTTFSARSYLQPQLHKAVGYEQARNDFFLFLPRFYYVFLSTSLEWLDYILMPYHVDGVTLSGVLKGAIR